MFFDFCQESGYDKILKVLGATPRDFLQNLDALHDHLATIYPGMRAPSFRCTERPEDGALILHYYSEREGLEPIVIGLVKVRNILFYLNLVGYLALLEKYMNKPHDSVIKRQST